MLIPNLCANAKVTKTHNSPRIGDKIYSHSCNIKDNKKGADVEWDFSELNLVRKTLNLSHISVNSSADSVLRVHDGKRQYLCITDDTLKVYGEEDIIYKVIYDAPIAKIVYPMAYGDSVEGYYYGRGRCYDRFAMRTIGKYKTTVEACGRVTLPSGELIDNVNKFSTVKTFTNIYYQVDSIAVPKVDYTDTQIEMMLDQDSTTTIVKELAWYAKGYRYPLFESIEACEKLNQSNKETRSYYFPIDGQLTMPIDEVNMDIRNAVTTPYSPQDKVNDETSGMERFKYDFNVDKSLQQANIKAQSDVSIDIEVILASVGGIVYKTIKKSNVTEIDITLDYSMLQRGQYAVYINVGTDVYTEKFEK
jgi:hypothetical protein